MPSDTVGGMRLPSYRSAPSFYLAFGLGILAAVAYLCAWPPAKPPVLLWGLDPGSYYRMAQHPFRPEHLPFVLRPVVPLLVRLLPVPTAWQFALANVFCLGALCALVERIAARLGRPPVVGVAAGAVVCASNPVWKSFHMLAMVDIPVLCLIAGSLLLLLSERVRGAWALAVTSALAHPLGLMMGAGALLARSWAAGITAGIAGAGLAGLYALFAHRLYLPVADGIAVGFKAAIAANQPSLVRSMAAALLHGIGPLVIAYLRAPAAYRRIILPVTGAVLIAMAGASDWMRLLGFLCPVLAPVALPAPALDRLRTMNWRECAWPVTSAAVLVVLFLWPILPSIIPALYAPGPNTFIRNLLLLFSAAQLVPWHLIQRPAVDTRLPA